MFLFPPSIAISSLLIDISRRTPVFFPASRWRLPRPPPQMHPSTTDAPFPSSPRLLSFGGVCLLPSLHTPMGGGTSWWWHRRATMVLMRMDVGSVARPKCAMAKVSEGDTRQKTKGKDVTWRQAEAQAADGSVDERMARESRPRPGAGRRRMRPAWRRFPGEETRGTEGEDAWSCEPKRCVHTRRKTQERKRIVGTRNQEC